MNFKIGDVIHIKQSREVDILITSLEDQRIFGYVFPYGDLVLNHEIEIMNIEIIDKREKVGVKSIKNDIKVGDEVVIDDRDYCVIGKNMNYLQQEYEEVENYYKVVDLENQNKKIVYQKEIQEVKKSLNENIDEQEISEYINTYYRLLPLGAIIDIKYKNDEIIQKMIVDRSQKIRGEYKDYGIVTVDGDKVKEDYILIDKGHIEKIKYIPNFNSKEIEFVDQMLNVRHITGRDNESRYR